MRGVYASVRDLGQRLEPWLQGDDFGPEQVQTFSYTKPEERGKNKEIVLLTRTRTSRGSIHVIRKGGEETLHSHATIDGFWFVLSGRIKFHGEGDVVLGEFGPKEGIFVPRGTRYWFESVGAEEAELLQFIQFHGGRWTRKDHEKPKWSRKEGILLSDARTDL